MTWVQILVIIVAGSGIGAFLLAVMVVLSSSPDYMPMPPDEEYQWLTKEHGLSHDEALEYMHGPQDN